MSVTALVADPDCNTRHPAADAVAAVIAGAARAVVARRDKRARTLALHDLPGMDPHRLHDLALSLHRFTMRGPGCSFGR